jgi:hypothetical protein
MISVPLLTPFGLSLSKALLPAPAFRGKGKGFDKLGANGDWWAGGAV